jgi:CheY-like chemotaxis protein
MAGEPVDRILIVDDNADLRLTMKLLLESEGYRVELAANGREALQVQRERPARILVTDLFMPEADGLETIQRFRTDYPEMPIIVISGGGSAPAMKTDHLAVAKELGVCATLRKPFAPEALIALLRGL